MSGLFGFFMEPQNFSVNDGNGIRTIIFFAGCPLSCQWCSNPEGCTSRYKVAYYRRTCTGCGRCAAVCPSGIGTDLNGPGSREKCSSCRLCAEICPTKSRKSMVHRYTSGDILGMLEKQKLFYRFSGGGVTFSGGEATMQPDMLRELAHRFYDQGVDLALETSGYFDFEEVKDILEKMNLIFVDIKHMDDNKHKLYTGVGNRGILENISRLGAMEIPVVVRVPVITGVNSDAANVRAAASFVKTNIRRPKIELLPYHSFGDSKYEALGLAKPSEQFAAPSPECLRQLKGIIEAEGVEAVSYR